MKEFLPHATISYTKETIEFSFLDSNDLARKAFSIFIFYAVCLIAHRM